MFTSIEQGSRLTKGEQTSGPLPFVMSGTTNTGISGSVSNDVRVFPKHAITVDIFGNTFYRDYEFGMGDDTGALWNDDRRYSKSQLLYLTSVIRKSLRGLFDYGHKLRSSQVGPYSVHLPVDSDGKLDLDFMDRFVGIQQKLAIKGVVEWKDKEIVTMKDVVAA